MSTFSIENHLKWQFSTIPLQRQKERRKKKTNRQTFLKKITL